MEYSHARKLSHRLNVPSFLYAFGDWGTEEGQFNYPGDVALDRTGRVYVADRENDRIQIWSY